MTQSRIEAQAAFHHGSCFLSALEVGVIAGRLAFPSSGDFGSEVLETSLIGDGDTAIVLVRVVVIVGAGEVVAARLGTIMAAGGPSCLSGSLGTTVAGTSFDVEVFWVVAWVTVTMEYSV